MVCITDNPVFADVGRLGLERELFLLARPIANDQLETTRIDPGHLFVLLLQLLLDSSQSRSGRGPVQAL